jgi:hypothetical protein
MLLLVSISKAAVVFNVEGRAAHQVLGLVGTKQTWRALYNDIRLSDTTRHLPKRDSVGGDACQRSVAAPPTGHITHTLCHDAPHFRGAAWAAVACLLCGWLLIDAAELLRVGSTLALAAHMACLLASSTR